MGQKHFCAEVRQYSQLLSNEKSCLRSLWMVPKAGLPGAALERVPRVPVTRGFEYQWVWHPWILKDPLYNGTRGFSSYTLMWHP